MQTLERVSQDGEELLAVSTDKGGPYLSRALIITAGHGAFEPRKLGVEGIDEWEGKGLHYFVREKAVFADKTCVIVGGGDSALDWTLGLQDTAKHPIALVHRRDRFRALETSVNEAQRARRGGPRQDPDARARCATSTATARSSRSRSRTRRPARASRSPARR